MTLAPLPSPAAPLLLQATSNSFQIYKDISSGGRPPIPEPGSIPGGGFPGLPAYLALMQRCWAEQPAERPAFAEVVAELRQVPLGAAAIERRVGPPGRPLHSPSPPEREICLMRGLPLGMQQASCSEHAKIGCTHLRHLAAGP